MSIHTARRSRRPARVCYGPGGMAIFLLHGIVDEYVPGASAYRNYVPRAMFERYLRERAAPFADWRGDGSTGDLLTVDDATRAGADACLAARRLGHPVLFFVNPYQVVSGEPYFFSLLAALLDARRVTSAEYGGTRYDLADPAAVQALRRAVRAAVMRLPAAESHAAVARLASMLGADGVTVAAHEQPLRRADLIALRDAGVRIENHGWSHVEIDAIDDDAFARHVREGRDWLQRELGVDASLYAVPFGATDVAPPRQRWVDGGYFLASDRFPRGRVGAHGWNRRDLLIEMRARNRVAAYLAARTRS
ncbi:MAG: polysaccharide deacetylase family protein [Deltaproteobacteria bacterium]|nr:polysaccharide deacetylase family protein [Deltaproteobacteria bacterium]